jgi:hypothetical protein
MHGFVLRLPQLFLLKQLSLIAMAVFGFVLVETKYPRDRPDVSSAMCCRTSKTWRNMAYVIDLMLLQGNTESIRVSHFAVRTSDACREGESGVL